MLEVWEKSRELTLKGFRTAAGEELASIAQILSF